MTNSPPRSPLSNVTLALQRGRLGMWPVVAIVMAAAAPLTVVAGGATTGWAVTGVVGIPVAYLAVAAILGVFSVGYVAMSRKIVNAGAFYSYIARGLGRVPGVAASFVALLAYNAMQVGLYGGFGAVLAGFLADRAGVDVAWWMCAFAAWAVIAVMGVLRVDLNGSVLAVLLVTEIGIAAVFAVVELAHPANNEVTFTTLAPSHLFAAGIGAALVTAITGFVGFEATAVYSEETKDPQRTVPRATYTALIIIGLLYALCSWAMSVAAGPDNVVEAARTNGTELMFTLVQPHLGQTWVDAGHLLFVTSLFAALLAFHNTAARYAFALGRERVLPQWLGITSRRNRSPKWGSLTQTLLAAVVIAGYAIAGLDPIVYLFFWITVLGGLGVLILMAATSLAVVAFFVHDAANRAGVSVWRRAVAPTLAALGLLAILAATLNQFATLLGVDATSPWRWVLPSSFAVAAVLGAGWALILKVSNPEVYDRIGRGANSVTPDVPQAAPQAAGAGGGVR
ncbi:APC family permease [Micromonospora endolithica]|uniref:APC family permease n=1 Tax=Micromonospora endolithica TaxID=230091 RepID=A0A3A9ZIR0_9ACTN|nr:APC family permease [Micromonospora endolithica]RKN48223.1 APC family permease [Micromonospora endolithica]TWJ24737.1 amino acid/polyamine/organocation transporter, APC superfamily (TC 2.A.3) [Micromonospora endolithica]